ncbi:hypothetical protein M9Y10_044418 [Tritrichomonas musculus]|uniref:Uncharacterized protein n=1 Tax=Tritrichomonas musculus TaxID=1915356 RepID=A0ABR2JSC6_9EUKA
MNAINQIDLDEENLTIHFLVPHSGDMLQPLNVGIFGAMKRFMSNNFAYQTKQLFKIHKLIHQACSPANCKVAFASSGIVTRLEKQENTIKEIAKKVNFFEISYIELILRSGPLLTDIQ